MQIRRIHLALLLTSLLALPARAAVPDPRFTTMDQVLVGSPLGVAIGGTPAGFDVVVRDVNNAPLVGVVVEIRAETANLKLYTTQAAGTTIDCQMRRFSRVTNAQGAVNFVARFGGWSDPFAVEVTAGGVILGSVQARSPDYDKDGKVALADLTAFTVDFMTHPATMRSDFDLNNVVGLGDFAIFSDQFNVTPQALCP